MKTIKIGSIFKLGADEVRYEVIKLKQDATQGEQAVLEMIDFGGPLETYDVAYLETLEQE